MSAGSRERHCGLVHTGVKGGELKVGVGSRVERAGAPVSPRGSAPRPLDLRCESDMDFCFCFLFFYFFFFLLFFVSF